MAKRYQLFKFYVCRDTHPDLVHLLEGMPPHQRNAFIRDAIEHYEKRPGRCLHREESCP